MTTWRARLQDDDGQVLVLVVGAAVLAIAIAVTLAAVSGQLLERKRLVSVADNAAAFAAADLGTADVYLAVDPDPRARAPLTERQVRDAVTAHLASGVAEVRDVRLVDVTTDGESVTVTLRRVVRPPLVGAFADVLGGEGIVVVGTGTARRVPTP